MNQLPLYEEANAMLQCRTCFGIRLVIVYLLTLAITIRTTTAKERPRTVLLAAAASLRYSFDNDHIHGTQSRHCNIAQVGIRAHGMVSAFGREENTGTIAIQGNTEASFEWNVIFTNAGSTNGKPVWWKFSKYLWSDAPKRLSLPPEVLQLLRED